MNGRNGMVTRWGRVPAWWLLHPGMDADRFCVMAAMATYADEAGRCDPSQATLARHLRRSRPWVNGVVARLAAEGFLEKTGRSRRNGGNTSCEYRLRLEPPEAGVGTVIPVTPPDAMQDSPRHRGDQSQPVPEQSQTRPEPRAASEAPSPSREPARPAVTEVPQDWRPSEEELERGRGACPEADLLGHAALFVHRCRAKGYRYAPAALGDAWLAWLIEDHGPGGRRASQGNTSGAPGGVREGGAGPRPPWHAPRRPADRGERLEGRMSAWAAAAAAPRLAGRI